MPAYAIFDITVTDPARYEDYKKMAPRSIEQYGGRYLTRGGAVSTHEGDRCRFQKSTALQKKPPAADSIRPTPDMLGSSDWLVCELSAMSGLAYNRPLTKR